MNAVDQCKESRKYLTNKTWVLLLVSIAVISIFLRAAFGFFFSLELEKDLKKPTVIMVNSKQVLSRSIRRDTIKITITKIKSDTVLIEQPQDTLNID